MRLYHGSDYPDIEALDGGNPGGSNSLGWGVYLTSDEEFARKFGKYLYEAVPTVPEEDVLRIDVLVTYECDQDMSLMTPGSSAFTFEVQDRGSRETFRYSVLGDCDEQVRAGLLAQVLLDVDVATYEVDTVDPDVRKEFGKWAPKVLSDPELRNDIKWRIGDTPLDDDQHDELVALLEGFAEDVVDDAEVEVEEMLGTEIDLGDLAQTTLDHGYSAFFIDEYAPGNEFVIVDQEFLPIPTVRVK